MIPVNVSDYNYHEKTKPCENAVCCIYIIGVRNEPPPIVDVIIDETSIENSVDFTSSTLTPDTVSWFIIITLINNNLFNTSLQFTPDRQQLFRETTAIAVNTYCNSVSCKLILPSGEIQKYTLCLDARKT